MSETCNSKENPKSFKEYLKSRNFVITLAAIVVGAFAGYLYYHFVGCSSGSCAITGNPYISVIFGGLFGYFLVNRPCSC